MSLVRAATSRSLAARAALQQPGRWPLARVLLEEAGRGGLLGLDQRSAPGRETAKIKDEGAA